MKYVVCNDSRVDSLVAIMLNRYVKGNDDLIVATKIVVFPTMLRSMSRNLVSESLEFIIPVFAQCLYFKIDRCLSVMQSDRRRSQTTRPYIALLFFSTNGALSRCRRTVLCVNEFHGSIQTCTWFNEIGDNSTDNTRLRWWETIVTATVVVVHCWLTEKVMSQSSNSRNTKVKITLFWILIKILVINKQSNFLTKKFWPSWRQNDFWLKNFIEIKNQNKVISIFCWILRVR